MASRRIKKKKQQQKDLKQIKTSLVKASPFIDEADLKELSKQITTVQQRANTLSLINILDSYVEDRQAEIIDWRNRGATVEYGSVTYHNTLANMEKYHLIKHYWDLVKKGYIDHDFSLTYYDDVADWSLEYMSNEELAKVIAEAEDKRAKMPIIDFMSLTPI